MAGNFFVYANSRHFLEKQNLLPNRYWCVFFGGAIAGTTLSAISLPTNLVKVQQQMSSTGLGKRFSFVLLLI